MIEQYLQVTLELLKEIWFQLDSLLGLEETVAFKLIKLYLIELQDTPIYKGIAFTMLALILIGLYRAKSIVRERERKKAENVMEEMDEEDYEEIHVNIQKVMGGDEKEFKLKPISPALANPSLNKNPKKFQRLAFDSEDGNKEYASHESANNKLNKQLEGIQENTPPTKDLNNAASDDNFYREKEISTEENFKEPVMAKANESINDPESKTNYSINNNSGGEVDSLMNRLKDLQVILNIGDTSSTVESNIRSAGDPPFLEKQNFTRKSPKVTLKDNKKYIKALESLIFLEDQKKH